MKGRSYSKEFKEQILQEVKEVGSISLVGRKHWIASSTIFTWIKKSESRDQIKTKSRKKTLIEGKNNVEELNELTQKNDKLKRILSEKEKYTLK